MDEDYKYKGDDSKKLNEGGGKAWQTTDRDKTVPYKAWINKNNTNGFWLDIDAIKFRKVDGEYKPYAITELTACQWETKSKDKYLASLEHRILERDRQGSVMSALGKLLDVPVYWVLFPPSVSWIYAFSLKTREWTLFEPEEWLEFLRQLK